MVICSSACSSTGAAKPAAIGPKSESFIGAAVSSLGILIILFLIFSIRKINYKLAKEKLVARKNNSEEFFRLVKDVIVSSVLSVLTIIVTYLSIRELGYFALAISVISAFLVVPLYLSQE